MSIHIIQHPLAPSVITVTRNGALIPAVNGKDIKGLHAVFVRLVVLRKRKA
jgi:hypothetical protein